MGTPSVNDGYPLRERWVPFPVNDGYPWKQVIHMEV